MSSIKLGKSRDSRTRGQKKEPNLSEEILWLKEKLKTEEIPFADYLIEKGYSIKSANRYLGDVQRYQRWAEQENIEIEGATYADVLHYIQSRRSKACGEQGRTISQRTQSNMLNSIKHYYQYLESSEQIAENPIREVKIRGIKRKRLYSILTKAQLEELYHNYPTEIDSKQENQNWYKLSQLIQKRNKVILSLLIYQGLNATEICRMKISDLKLREGKVYVAGTRKSNERTMELEAVQVMDMMEYVLDTRKQLEKMRKIESESLFITGGKSKNLHNGLQSLLKKLQKQESQLKTLMHIRTSVITHWLKRYNLREVQQMAGHRFVSSTEAYKVNDLEDLQEDIEKFHPLDK